MVLHFAHRGSLRSFLNAGPQSWKPVSVCTWDKIYLPVMPHEPMGSPVPKSFNPIEGIRLQRLLFNALIPGDSENEPRIQRDHRKATSSRTKASAGNRYPNIGQGHSAVASETQPGFWGPGQEESSQIYILLYIWGNLTKIKIIACHITLHQSMR